MSNRKVLYVLIFIILLLIGFSESGNLEWLRFDAFKSTTPKVTDNIQYFTVERIVDGDTLVLSGLGKVRLLGIDTPELEEPRKPVECFALEASARLKELTEGQVVGVEFDETQDQVDKFGRPLVYLYRKDGLFVNLEMIAGGYAFEYTYNAPYLFQREFKMAEAQARTAQQGLWSPQTCL